ncbi:dihydrolipoamide acetyltransferase family protein [Arthrobacter sp. zg-Y1143]|uniref:dihydrolipoamide acetyltransferase family protein n=1 Tax=Arthrobacter sp. zg-Y1143 TaxID=3049065 RepID=UPI0024C2C626|nr:dihydrolipoamide acetyltransferase family protein [Arthrobacter sp. zg-Y1143]MDK1326833.1 dihydrolipoamide acetyltransferase family protein [Arthrobacter sp. zg-Y1143]
MSVRTFLLPDLGEGLTEAELVNWLVAVGDTVAVDQPVAEVETAKSLVEVPSPFAGRVAQLHGSAGESVDVGRPLISVDTAPAGPLAAEPSQGDSANAASAGLETAPAAGLGTAPAAGLETAAAVGTAEAAASAAGEAYRQEEKAGSGNVLIGYGTPAADRAPRRTRAPKRRAGGPNPAERGAAGGSAQQHPGAEAPRCISPLVRRMARDAGLRLTGLTGTGPDGLILRRDVQSAMAAKSVPGGMPANGPVAGIIATVPVAPAPAAVAAPAAPAPAAVALAPAPAPALAPAAGTAATIPAGPRDPRTGLAITSRTPLRGLRRTAAATLSRSRAEIPEATVWVDVDATALVELRADLARDGQGVPSLLSFLARFTLAGLARYPELNTRYVPAGEAAAEPAGAGARPGGQSGTRPGAASGTAFRGGAEAAVEAFDGVNLGIAVQAPRGLMVPAVRRADSLSTRELDTEIRRLTAAAQEGRATAAELTSGTFTLNNYGVFGVDGSAAIINYPESAILGVGRIIDKPWVVDGRLAVRKMTELTLVFDHRVCDGGTAGGFLRYVADAVENPARVLADL